MTLHKKAWALLARLAELEQPWEWYTVRIEETGVGQQLCDEGLVAEAGTAEQEIRRAAIKAERDLLVMFAHDALARRDWERAKEKTTEAAYLDSLLVEQAPFYRVTERGRAELDAHDARIAAKLVGKAEQARIRDWCDGWFAMDASRRAPLAQWIALKLDVDAETAERYARWLTADHKAREAH